MKLTIEINQPSDLEPILLFLKQMGWQEPLHIKNKKTIRLASNIQKGDKSLDPTALFGIWSEQPKDIQIIRAQAWDRKTND